MTFDVETLKQESEFHQAVFRWDFLLSFWFIEVEIELCKIHVTHNEKFCNGWDLVAFSSNRNKVLSTSAKGNQGQFVIS